MENNFKKEYEYLILPYYQKSLNLLYPLLGFKKEKLPQTYLFWDDIEEGINNFELIVNYLTIDDNTEKNILNNYYLKSCYNTTEGLVYIFNLITFSEDVLLFIEGKYSKFSQESKKIVRNFHGDLYLGNTPKIGKPFHMIFNPSLYKSVIAKELGVEEYNIEEVWDIFDKEKETFKGIVLENSNCKDNKIILV